MEKSEVISNVCEFIESGDHTSGAELIELQYPFTKLELVKRQYTKAEMLKVFLRDGFTDRYSGEKLVFPPVLRVLSEIYPKEFPFHPNWKSSECHPAYWDLLATIDHVIPIAKGGTNHTDNLVTTSMKRNSAKSNFTLTELNWDLFPQGNPENWDGKVSWFMKMAKKHPALLEIPYIRQWYVAAVHTVN